MRMLRAADEARRERVSQYNSLLQVVAAQRDEEETTQLRRRKQSKQSNTTADMHYDTHTTSSPVSRTHTSTFSLTDGLRGLNASL